MSNIIKREQFGVVPQSMADLERLGSACVASGFFADAKDAGQAMIKIQAGAELGIPPVQAMTNINVIKGRITLSAGLMAALLRRAGYRIRVTWTQDPLCCNVSVWQGAEHIGDSPFSTQDARTAGLGGANWQKYPRNMLYARAVSNAARWYAPEVLTGCYLPEELDDAPEDLRPTQPIETYTRSAPALDRTPARSHQSQPTPQPTTEPAHTPDRPDPDAHPGEGWQAANRTFRGVINRELISEDERKLLLMHYWQRESSTHLKAKHLHQLANKLHGGPTDDDRSRAEQAKKIIEDAGGIDQIHADEAAQMRDLCNTPWQVILLDRVLAGGEG